MDVSKILEFEEGLVLHPYLCSEGYVTIGLGTKLHKSKGLDPNDFPIRVSRRMAVEWLHSELAIKDSRLTSLKGKVYQGLSPDRQAIIMSMTYQLGTKGILGFRNMWRNLKDGNYVAAGAEMMDSRWAVQTPERAERHRRVMVGEYLEVVYADWII